MPVFAPPKPCQPWLSLSLHSYCHRLAPTYSVREDYPLLHSIPFNSANKWALTVCHCPGALPQQLVMMKGAPEIIIDRCSSQLVDG